MYLQAINEKDVSNIVNCYEESAESFMAGIGAKQPTDYLDNMEKRKSMLNFSFFLVLKVV
jgi:glucose-induced degradation protein 8